MKTFLANLTNPRIFEIDQLKECKKSYTFHSIEECLNRRLSKDKMKNEGYFFITAENSKEARMEHARQLNLKVMDELDNYEKLIKEKIKEIESRGDYIIGFSLRGFGRKSQSFTYFIVLGKDNLYKEYVSTKTSFQKLLEDDFAYIIDNQYDSTELLGVSFIERIRKNLSKKFETKGEISWNGLSIEININHPQLEFTLSDLNTVRLSRKGCRYENRDSSKFSLYSKGDCWGNGISINLFGINRYRQLYKECQKTAVERADFIIFYGSEIYFHIKDEKSLSRLNNSIVNTRFMMETFFGKLDVTINFPDFLLIANNDFLISNLRLTENKLEILNIDNLPYDLKHSTLLINGRRALIDELKRQMKDDFPAFALVSELDDE